MTPNESLDVLLRYVVAGLSIIPIAEGKKNPHPILGATHDLLKQRATDEELKKWIAAGVTSWAIAGGAVSNNLVVLDFDEKHYLGLYDLWYAKLSDEQKAVVEKCVKSSTRNNGTHLRYRTETSQPTEKLSRRAIDEKIETTSETKAEGGYALIPPSAGYAWIHGDMEHLPTVTDKMHKAFTEILRTFNEVEDESPTKYEYTPTGTPIDDRPGDRLNALATWTEILEPHGWVQESKNRWRRPGKKANEGISATTDYNGIPMLYVFSTAAAPFTENKGYSKFRTFALLNHGGNFTEAAKAAAKRYPHEEISGAGRVNNPSKEPDAQPVVDDKQRSQKMQLMELVTNNPDVTLFRDEYDNGCARVVINDHKEIMACGSKRFKQWLSHSYLEHYDNIAEPSAITSAIHAIESKAVFKGKEHKLHNRVAREGETIWYDLADTQNRAIRITSEGWDIVSEPPTIFRRQAHQLAQVEPLRDGDAMALFRFVNVKNPEQQLLLLVYLVSCLIPGFPHPLLYIHGQHGSAKSTVSKIIRLLIDPSRTALLNLPKDTKELALQLTRHHLVFYENVSWISYAASDLLCMGVTGGSISKRMLYTDADDFFVTIQTNICINGINIAAVQPDLLERTMLLALERVEDTKRRNEENLYAEFEKERPRILGALFDAAVKALATRPNIVIEPLPRMADFAQWGSAIAEAFGFTKEEFMRVYQSKINEQSDEALEASTEATVLLSYMDSIDETEWQGEPSQLFTVLKKVVVDDVNFLYSEAFPKRANQLMKKLNILKPNLRVAGLELDSKKVNGRRQVIVRKINVQTVQSVPTDPLALQESMAGDDRELVSSAVTDPMPSPEDNRDDMDAKKSDNIPF